ncbi:hypothetical protein LSCM1_02809 [Leishmania martiniquensis]|uniref:Uncharacterized protein n=1 Tax=Leishmania martiniquensis TaxID=1580590 RepID=A0A836GCG8_9TRYP|nr:hypothetical protein LSCM1_02809 [Leishmania martiniquensis]
MATATPPRSRGTEPPLPHSSGEALPRLARSVTEASEVSTNGQYFNLPSTPGNEESDGRSSSAISTCGGDKDGELRWRASRRGMRQMSGDNDVGTRDEDPAYSAAVSIVSSSYFSAHMLAEAAHERATEQRLAENLYSMCMFRSPGSQASERTGDTAEPLAMGCSAGGAAPSSLSQPVTRMTQSSTSTVFASSRGMPSGDIDDPYHVLSMPTAGTMYLISHANSDEERGSGTARASQQDLYCLNASVLKLSTGVCANPSAHQQRDSISLRGGCASATSCDRVVAPVSWEYGEWFLTPHSATREAFSVHPAGAPAPATGDERHSAPLMSSAAADVTTELMCQPLSSRRFSLPLTVSTTALARERPTGIDTSAKLRGALCAVAAQVPFGAADGDAPLEVEEQSRVAVQENVVASASTPLCDSAATEVCVAVEGVGAGTVSPVKSAVYDGIAANNAAHEPSEAEEDPSACGSVKLIVRRRCRRASHGGGPAHEALPLPAADVTLQQPPSRPSPGDSATSSVTRGTRMTLRSISSGLQRGCQSAFTDTACVGRSAVPLASDITPLPAPSAPPACRGADAPPHASSPAPFVPSTSMLPLLPPEAVATVRQPRLTVCGSVLSEVPRAPAGHDGRLTPLLAPDHAAKGCPSDVLHRAENHSIATTVAGATSSSTSTFSEDLTSGSSPMRVCAQSMDLQLPPIGADPRRSFDDDTLPLPRGWGEKATDPSGTLRAACEANSSAVSLQERPEVHITTPRCTPAPLTVTASETLAAATMGALAFSRGLSGGGAIVHPTAAVSRRLLQANDRAQQYVPKECPMGSCGAGSPSGRAMLIPIALSKSPGISKNAPQLREEVDSGEAAGARESGRGALSSTRSPSGRRRRVGFKETMEVVLPDSKSLRVSVPSWLEFRNPTMREQGKEMMPSTEEVYTHLVSRSNALCALVVVDEDAVRKPCLVVSGLSVRVYEEDKEVTLASSRMAHGVMKALKKSCVVAPSRFLRSGSYNDDDDDSSDSGGAAVGIRRRAGLSNRAASSGGGGLPSTLKSFVLLPDKKERRSRSGELDAADPRTGEFDRYLHKFDVDETLSRLAGKKECHSMALELLMRTWVTGHNTCLLLGNGSGRSTHSLDVAVEAVENAMSMLRERLRDPASRVELRISMGEVADDEDNGEGAVADLLASSSGSEEDENEGDEPEKSARQRCQAASKTSNKSNVLRRPSVQLARSPLLGTLVKGLRSIKIDDATHSTGAIGRVLTLGFLRFNMSTHSSGNNSMSNLSSLSSVAVRKVHTSFATLQLKTICRGADMRSARLSARESTSRERKFGSKIRRSRSEEYRADVFVSSLLLVYFGTEYMVLDTLVQRSQAYRTTMCEEAEGFVHPNAPSRHQKPAFHPANWLNAIGFLESLLCDALGGRTRTLACLCLSEYDSRATLWLRAVSRARRIANFTPNCGNVRNYLEYLLEQYDYLEASQHRRKQDARLRLPELGAVATSKSPKGGRLSGVLCSKKISQWSAYCVKKMVAELDAFLAAPTGEIPSMERLEIAHEIIPATQPDPLTGLSLPFLPRGS